MTMCPLGGPLVGVRGGLLTRGKMVCHCMLIETPASGLVLVDTGFGSQDIADPNGRIGRAFVTLTQPSLDPQQIALAQVTALGYSARDVRHVVLTHMDLDHAGGLGDFADAQVHVMSAELDAAVRRPSFKEKNRYKPAQWAHGPKWEPHDPSAGERWFGFGCVRDMVGLPPEILMIPLAGHSRGHAAVAVESAGEWNLHCGDAYFHHRELDAQYSCPAGLKHFQRIVATDRRAQRENLDRLRQLRAKEAGAVRLFCAHDPEEFARAQEA